MSKLSAKFSPAAYAHQKCNKQFFVALCEILASTINKWILNNDEYQLGRIKYLIKECELLGIQKELESKVESLKKINFENLVSKPQH